MAVEWKKGSGFSVEAKVVHEQVEALKTKHGGSLTAEQIVVAAKSKRNPLHPIFDWDDANAANEHRLETARVMMRSLVIVREELKTDRPQRVYEVIREPQQGKHRIRHAYRTMDDILKNEDWRAELLTRALRDLIVIRNRYRDLQELAVVMRAIDELVQTTEL